MYINVKIFNYANTKLCSLKWIVKPLEILELLKQFNYLPLLFEQLFKLEEV